MRGKCERPMPYFSLTEASSRYSRASIPLGDPGALLLRTPSNQVSIHEVANSSCSPGLSHPIPCHYDPLCVHRANHCAPTHLYSAPSGQAADLASFVPKENTGCSCRPWECGWTQGEGTAGRASVLQRNTLLQQKVRFSVRRLCLL